MFLITFALTAHIRYLVLGITRISTLIIGSTKWLFIDIIYLFTLLHGAIFGCHYTTYMCKISWDHTQKHDFCQLEWSWSILYTEKHVIFTNILWFILWFFLYLKLINHIKSWSMLISKSIKQLHYRYQCTIFINLRKCWDRFVS